MRSDARPLSPHLQVYRWQITMTLSILHRAAGIVLCGGAVLLVWWLCAAAEGGASYAGMQRFLGSIVGMFLLFCWSVALFYHLCNGLRHLWWDTGRGLDIPSVYRGGYIALGGTAALTVITWVVALLHRGH